MDNNQIEINFVLFLTQNQYLHYKKNVSLYN